MIIVTFSKSSVFLPPENENPAFSRTFEKLRFSDGLVWMLGLTVEIKLRFQISPA